MYEAERGPTARFAGVRIVVVPPVEMRLPGALVVLVGGFARGLGVTLLSAEGSRERLVVLAGAGVRVDATLGRGADASDMGGEGGSRARIRESSAREDFEPGGVVTRGELAVESGEPSMVLSKVGEPRADMSVEIVERWRDSCFLILSCKSSASILRSPSSSRRRCDSIRRCSLSCSPILISSSINTALSMAWL